MKKPTPKDRALQIAGQLYYKWKLDDMRRTGGDAVKLIDSLLDLRNQIVLKVVDAGLSDWIKFTTDLIDEKIQVIGLKGVRNVNRLLLAKGPNRKPYYFVSAIEFLAIPEVAAIKNRPDFVGFIGQDAMVSALFEDGEVVPVGAVISDLGLGKVVLPAHAVRDALERAPRKAGRPGRSDTPPPAEKPAPGPADASAGHPDPSAESGANPS